MGVAMTLKEYLDSNAFEYEIIEHLPTTSSLRSAENAHVPGDMVAKPVLLGDDDSYLLAVIPASHRLDIDRINSLLGRGLEIMKAEELDSTFSDCEHGAIPPVGQLYGVDTVVDPSLLDKEDIYFESGDHEHMIHMKGEDFRRLLQDAAKHHVSHHL
ncbi:MAG: YbaK/EbsC family protein [Chromatiales bacterium]|jgi:Ala-tRNA(Pro) deacylase